MNILEDIPYSDEGLGKRIVVNKEDILMMQVALKAGQEVPRHKANANVKILVIEGKVKIVLRGEASVYVKGDLIAVDEGTLMSIANTGDPAVTFLVIKTPNPRFS